MPQAFQVGDRVQLSVIGLAEVATLENQIAIPFGIGRVVDLGFIEADDVIVKWPDQGLQCGPDWLVLVAKEH
jgi:hypothetical protein